MGIWSSIKRRLTRQEQHPLPLHPDPQQLLQAFVDFAQAASWPQSKRVLEQHPELLGNAVDTLVGQLAAAQESKEARDLVKTHRVLLQRCRSIGVEAAFAEIERAMYLNNLVLGLRDRYARSGQLADLKAAIEAYQQALAATPADAPERARYLNNLGNGLRDFYARSGQLADLKAAIEAYQQALAATPADAPERAMYLNNLGNGLRDLYMRSGQLADLEAAIEVSRQAVAPTPADAPERAAILNNLGGGLRNRYARSGQLADLKAAIEVSRQAVARHPRRRARAGRYPQQLGWWSQEPLCPQRPARRPEGGPIHLPGCVRGWTGGRS